MDNLPEAAFDNLYKFAAIAGLAIILTSVWLPVRTGLDLWDKMQAYNIAREETMADLNWQDAQKGLQPSTLPTTRDCRTVSEDMAKLSGRLHGQHVAIDQNGHAMIVLAVTATVGAVGGFYLAGWGFKHWRRLQLIHDELLEAEVAEVRAKLAGEAATAKPPA